MSGPDVWGPYGWKFIHYITLGYPTKPTENDKKIYYDFFMKLAKVIPCSICSNHFMENMKITPLSPEVLSGRTNLVAWGIEMHNHVNRMNNKKVYTIEEGLKAILSDELGECKRKQITSEPIIEKFNNKNKEDKKSYENMIQPIVIIILILIILYLLYKK